MISWNQLRKYQLVPPTHKLGRKENIQKLYERHLRSFNNIDITIEEYLVEKYFDEDVDKDLYLEKNSFPYNVEENITHYVLWINPSKIINNIQIYLYIDYIFDDNEYVYFENLPQNRSINFRHFHIFAKFSLSKSRKCALLRAKEGTNFLKI